MFKLKPGLQPQTWFVWGKSLSGAKLNDAEGYQGAVMPHIKK